MQNSFVPPVGIIDIGSNSVRFMAWDGSNAIQDKQLASTVLGEGLSLTGKLSPAAIERTAQAVAHFFALAQKKGCKQVLAFATEAVRAAQNGGDLISRVQQLCGLAVEVLSGTVEAEIGFSGSCADFDGKATVLDAGGASVEIICGDSGHILYEKSLPLGMVRLIDLLGRDREKIHAYIREKLRDYGSVPALSPLVGIGGTATSIGAMALGQTRYNAAAVHKSVVSAAKLTELEERVFSSDNVRRDFPVLSENRARVIGHGLILFREALVYLQKDGFTVSDKDNMEGYLLYKKDSIYRKTPV